MGALLKIQKVTKDFGGLRAVNEMSFDVEQGSIVGLLGPNGAGKTTLFNAVTGTFAPTSGRVEFDGEDITGLPSYERVKRGLVRTFQANVLYNESTVMENVIRGFVVRQKSGFISNLFATSSSRTEDEMQREQAMDILRTVELERYADEVASQLAYGHQRALGIAICLATGPRVLMLDEPVAGMNAAETEQMVKLIKQLNSKGLTVLVVEHDMKFVMNLCHKLVVMNYGKKICEGTPSEVRRNDDVISAYLGAHQDAVA